MGKKKPKGRTTKPAAARPARTARAAGPEAEPPGQLICVSNFISPAQRRAMPAAYTDVLRMRGLDLHGPVAAVNVTGSTPVGTSGGPLSAVFDTQVTWEKGKHLRVRFLDRLGNFPDHVEHYVKGWEEAADVHFDFVSSGPAEVRITFRQTDAFYSYIGKEVFGQPPDQHTMSLGFRPGENRPEEIRRLVLHEFGHSIGLMHEHQNPVGGIQWNWDTAIPYYHSRLPNLNRQELIAQLQAVPNSSRYLLTPFDAQSIMLYQIPQEVVLTGWRPEWMNNNTDLSASDRSTAAKIYGPGTAGGSPQTGVKHPLTINGPSVEESIDTDGEVDRFGFTIPTQGVYQAEADGDAIVRVTLADANDQPLTDYMPADSLTSSRGARLPFFINPGTYTLLVSASPFLATSRGRYRVRVISM